MVPVVGQISILDIANEGINGGCYAAELNGYSLGSLATAFGIGDNPDSISEFRGLSCPPGCGYVDGNYYYAVRNLNAHLGQIRGRGDIINGSYELYSKPSAANTSINSYTLLERYVNPNSLTVYNVPYTMTRGLWITTVNVTVDGGCPAFDFPTPSQTGSYGAGFYISIIAPFLPLP
jgi:hypothetical protein